MKFISIYRERILIAIYICILSVGIFSSYQRRDNNVVTTFSMPLSKKVISIDPGHGGWDPGKVGTDNILEKDINLAIAGKVQSYLEQADAYVLMTRVDDTALGDKKSQDMRGRKEIANDTQSDIFVSIHQNSFTKESVKGAQVFYFDNSDHSKLLADFIQLKLNEFVQPDSTRVAKPNKNYYVLRQTIIPAVIVECGFLTNYEEKNLLLQDEYQDRIAWAIYTGILEYFKNYDTVE